MQIDAVELNVPGVFSQEKDIFIPCIPGFLQNKHLTNDSLLLATNNGYIINVKSEGTDRRDLDECAKDINSTHENLIDSVGYENSRFQFLKEIYNEDNTISMLVYIADVYKYFENEKIAMKMLNVYFKGKKDIVYRVVLGTPLVVMKTNEENQEAFDNAMKLLDKFTRKITKVYQT